MVRARNALHAKMACPQTTRTIAPKQSYSISATASLMNLSAVVQMSTKCLGFYKCKYFFGINWKRANRSPIGIRSSVVRHAPAWAPVHQMFSHRIRRIQVLTVLTPSPTYAAPNLQTWSSSQRVESAFITALELCRPSLQLVTILNSCPHHVRC